METSGHSDGVKGSLKQAIRNDTQKYGLSREESKII